MQILVVLPQDAAKVERVYESRRTGFFRESAFPDCLLEVGTG